MSLHFFPCVVFYAAHCFSLPPSFYNVMGIRETVRTFGRKCGILEKRMGSELTRGGGGCKRSSRDSESRAWGLFTCRTAWDNITCTHSARDEASLIVMKAMKQHSCIWGKQKKRQSCYTVFVIVLLFVPTLTKQLAFFSHWGTCHYMFLILNLGFNDKINIFSMCFAVLNPSGKTSYWWG